MVETAAQFYNFRRETANAGGRDCFVGLCQPCIPPRTVAVSLRNVSFGCRVPRTVNYSIALARKTYCFVRDSNDRSSLAPRHAFPRGCRQRFKLGACPQMGCYAPKNIVIRSQQQRGQDTRIVFKVSPFAAPSDQLQQPARRSAAYLRRIGS